MTPNSTFLATDGAGYERTMGRWSRRLAVPFVAFAGLAAGERVLDVGCGTGSLSREIARNADVARIDAVDLSPAYVEHARRTVHDARLTFAVADACALDLPAGAFDRVLSLLLLHFVPRPDLAVAAMRRAARPGGVVAAAVWDVRGGFVANRMFFDTAAALDPEAARRRARNYTRPMTRPGELAAAWHAAGFADVVETELAIRMEFASFDDWFAPLLGREGPVAEYLATLADDARERLHEAARSAYLDGEVDGPRSYVAVAWAVKGIVPGR
jgi:ubiquinone/menaquinone biosynthesis C-methylase UbiE